MTRHLGRRLSMRRLGMLAGLAATVICGLGFAPADDPQIAIAASVECTEQFGNDVAAPIFRDVAESLLDGE